MSPSSHGRERIPPLSLVFGFGPMLPMALAAIGAWVGAGPLPALAEWLAIIWAALILAFVAGVRRGYGFGNPSASTGVQIATMLAYFIPAGAALILAGLQQQALALACLAGAYILVIALDRQAALQGNAPGHFARLRPVQMAIAVVAMAALLLRRLI